MPYFSLYQAPWKTLPENPSFPGFFMGRLFAYGYPSDTFVNLPVSEIKHNFFYTVGINKPLKLLWIHRAGKKVLCLSTD